jgi:hypothetical protein
MRHISPRSACRGASLLVLLLLSLPSGQAFASGPGSALPIGAAGTQAVNGVAQSGAPPAPPAVQPTVAPVTGAVTQIVNKATEPVAGGAPTDVKKVTAPVSDAVVQSAGKTVAPVLDTTTQTARKAAAPVLQTASKTVAGTVAPVVKAATQSAGKTLDNATAPVLQTTTRTVNNAAAPVLRTATQTVGDITAPVLRTATQTVGDITTPAGNVATSTVAGIVQSVTGAPALLSEVASVLNLTPSSSSLLAAITRERPLLPGAATHLGDIGGTILSSSPSGALIRQSTDAPAFVATPPASGTVAAPASTALSNAQAGNPANSSSRPPGCLSRAGLMTKELVENCEAPIGGLSRVSVAWFLQVGIGPELPTAIPTSSAADNSGPAAAPSASSIRIPPAAPSPLPGGSSGAMASAAGMAFSIFLTLAGLLLMGGLAAMRLLRLASEPLRKAPFVLIPERPG